LICYFWTKTYFFGKLFWTCEFFWLEMSARYQIKVLKAFCKGCELCVAICPRRSMVLSGNVNKNGFHFPESNGKLCSGCGQCAIICPEAAIEIFATDEKTKKHK